MYITLHSHFLNDQKNSFILNEVYVYIGSLLAALTFKCESLHRSYGAYVDKTTELNSKIEKLIG